MRRILQDSGAEVVHIGHNRSAGEIVNAAIQEDAQGIAVSSYQGGHIEFFKYIVDLLKENDACHIKVFGGGGGVIIPSEIRQLHDYGVARIYSPEDGSNMGLQGMINDMLKKMDNPPVNPDQLDLKRLNVDDPAMTAQFIRAIQEQSATAGDKPDMILSKIKTAAANINVPVIGLTGTGGAGKSSFADELITRFLHDFSDIHIAVISCNPTRR